MIGKLTGLVDSIREDSAIIDVNGVGYLIYASAATLRSLPDKGQTVSVIIETHVREDHIHLYGFTEESERQWFLILNTVKGVGTKMALAILSVLSASQLQTAIMSKDKAAFTGISGVGPKLADRLLTELKGKGEKVIGGDDIAGLTSPTTPVAEEAGGQNKDITDAVSALTNLGYGRSDAFVTVTKIANQNTDISVEELIRNSLKELSA